MDQIKNAHIIFLSHFNQVNNNKVQDVISKIRLYNDSAFILKDEWSSYSGQRLVDILNSIKECEIDIKENTESTPASKIFTTISVIKPKVFSESEIDNLLSSLKNKEFGKIFRAKGILKLDNKKIITFNFTPHHYSWNYIDEAKDAKVIVIGSGLNNEKILKYFELEVGGIKWLK